MPYSKDRSSALTDTEEKKCRQYRSNSQATIRSAAGQKALKLKMRVVKLRSSMGSRIAFLALKILQPRSELKNSWKRLLQAGGMATLGEHPSLGRKRSVIHTIKPSCPPSQISICPPSNLFISQVSLSSSKVILLARYYKMRKQPSSMTPSNSSPEDYIMRSERLRVGQASKQLTVRWMWLWKSSQMERYESRDSVSAVKTSLVVLRSMTLVLCSFAERSIEAVSTLLSWLQSWSITMQEEIVSRRRRERGSSRGWSITMQEKLICRSSLLRLVNTAASEAGALQPFRSPSTACTDRLQATLILRQLSISCPTGAFAYLLTTTSNAPKRLPRFIITLNAVKHQQNDLNYKRGNSLFQPH